MCSISFTKHNKSSSLEAVGNWCSTGELLQREAGEEVVIPGKEIFQEYILQRPKFLGIIFMPTE